MPLQPAKTESILAPWISLASNSATYDRWPMLLEALGCPQGRPLVTGAAAVPAPNHTADWSHSLRMPALALVVTAPEDEPKEVSPAECHMWMRSPGPEPVFSFVQSSTALTPSLSMMALRVPQELALSDKGCTPILALHQKWMPVPKAEPVAAHIHSTSDLGWIAGAPGALVLPVFEAELEPLPVPDQEIEIPAACQSPAKAPEPEPVWSFLTPGVAVESFAPAAIQLPKFTAGIEPFPQFQRREVIPAACEIRAYVPGAEPAWSLVQSVVASEECALATVQLPQFTAELEPSPVLDRRPLIPAACRQPMRAPEPEPVFSFLRAATAGATDAAIVARAPGFESFAVAGPHIPSSVQFRGVPQAEPVMAGVWPHVADIPFEPIARAAEVLLPRISALSTAPMHFEVPAASQTVDAPAAEALEILLSASQSSTLVTAAACGLPQPSMLAATAAALEIARPVAGQQPQPVESLVVAREAGLLKSATVVRLQPFAVAASEGRTVPGFDAPRLAPPASKPQSAAAKVMVLPLSTIQVAVPGPEPYRPMPNMPQPGLLPLEFHAQRVRGEAVARPEWKNVRFSPLPPRFRLRTVWEKAEDQIAQKPVPKKSTIAEVFEMPEAKPKSSKWVGWAAKIAAGIVIIAATFYTAGSIRVNRSISVRAGVASAPASASGASSAGSTTTVASAPKSAPKGTIQRVRDSIAERAAVQYSDHLREGMEAWGASAKSYPTGWSRHPDGYVQPGALALFSPSLKYTDYQLEFFGQIEKKSIAWTVRAKDTNNYHAMKFEVIEAGLRPVIAIVHYDVIGGKAGRKMQTPLNVMVHNRTPMQVAVNVKGNSFVTSIDGEEVDTYHDDALPTGGVGFFADAGDKARLYWVKVSKNDDWLGHICAFLSGANGSSATAELWAPELPGSPAPWNPGDDRASLAGAWMFIPCVTATRKARFSKSQRYQTWNL